MAAQSGKYDYERIGEKPFQKLCNALLAHCFPEVRCFPVGHSDGGRDAVLPQDGKQAVVFQVKWTASPLKDPVSWLAETVREETANILRLIADGASEYYLMTSLAGTAVPKRGTMDKLDERLSVYQKRFGIPIKVWWRADIDARVDAAPDAIKWAYSDMLSGHDLMRYFIDGANAAAHDHRLRTLVSKVVATQWEEDVRVKFKQAELTSHDLTDLFVDVEGIRLAQARSTRSLQMVELGRKNLGGAAQYLLSASQPFTLVRGEPGQGKSTLGQYLCQVHRAAFLKRSGTGLPELPPGKKPRVPLRIDLRDYAAWLEGADPLEEHLGVRPVSRRRKSLEEFVAYLLRARSGGLDANVETVNDITERLPLLIVLDGLDEVARTETRSTVVKHIDEFSTRLEHSVVPAQVIVTTRPNAAALAEPTSTMYETIALANLKSDLRMTYLRKWAAARAVTGRDRRELERVFHQRSVEPHIDQLADNPMQLTILLYLLHKRGNSVPTGRTELYTSYMETFLDREAEKSPQVEEHRKDLEEVTAYLGWHLQADAERMGSDGRIALRKLQRTILVHLFDAEKDTTLVGALFTAVTDRVWALTSKVQGTFEFDVQPLREYFAARFLYEYAGVEQRGFDSSRVLRQLARRPYWLNVARFYAGFARPNELAGLVDALEEEKEAGRQPLQIRVAAWTLLADGVFAIRPRLQRKAAEFFLDDLSVRLMGRLLRSAGELPALPVDRGGREVAQALLASVDADPASSLAGERAFIAARLLAGTTEFTNWWCQRLGVNAATPVERTWLAVGAAARGGSCPTPEGTQLLTSDDLSAAADAIEAGLQPPADSVLEAAMVRAVLAGQCRDAVPVGTSLPADLLRVLAPQLFQSKMIPKATPSLASSDENGTHTGRSKTQMQAAWRRLLRRDPRLASLQRAGKAGRGEHRTTALWANTAQAIGQVFGPCWLAAEIAVIGAAAPSNVFVTGGAIVAGTQCLGQDADYSRLLQEIRRYRADISWWKGQHEQHSDSLSRATWALALATAADPEIVAPLLSQLDQAVNALCDSEVRALLASADALLSPSASGRPLPEGILDQASAVSPATALLLSYGEPRLASFRRLPNDRLLEMVRLGKAAWPAFSVLGTRMMRSTSSQPLVLEGFPFSLLAPAPADLPHVDVRNTELVLAILDHPARYPQSWVWAAQEARASHPVEPSTASHIYLADAATAERWFAVN
ncbi:NACHT domain-containing protein [Kitasatospora phosalacinea]|uniref:NACHT domain-containing protein n=1 Tax=Kitasatospora phosalacinea TaxID=2065 RepID=UPI0035D941D0